MSISVRVFKTSIPTWATGGSSPPLLALADMAHSIVFGYKLSENIGCSVGYKVMALGNVFYGFVEP